MLRKFNSFDAYLEDTGEARVKVASLNDIETFCQGLVPDPAFMYLHVIAMGAGDYYGCNKNGDYFPEKSLILRHSTFEENAHIYKEHNNKNGAPSYGDVVKSWYNPTMHRVELILAVDKEKAPDIVAKVERGEVPEVSMGARVPYDVCSICGNKASKKSEYCEHIRRELKHVYPNGRQAYMLNLQPTFFDISFVFRRADKLGLMLRKVASDIGTLDHVYDDEDLDKIAIDKEADVYKEADIDKEIPAEAIIKVLNKGMFNILPRLEKVEEDLPPALLDRLASKYSLQDILHSFNHNLVPLKPREFARIVIIHEGMPMHMYSDVLSGIEHADRRDLHCPGGTVCPEISTLLEPFLANRSSYGPHVVRRVILLKQANDLNKEASTFDNDLNHYKYDYSTIPVLYDEEQYKQRQQELANRHLRKPINPLAVALTLGAMYAAYRGVSGLKDVIGTVMTGVNNVSSPTGLALATAATMAAAGAIHGSGREKQASIWTSKAVTHFAAPFVGAHLASAHYRNKYMRGEDLNGVQTFIAENPDYLSLAAPFAVHMGVKSFTKNSESIGKAFKTGLGKVASDEELNKFADFADTLSQAALTGIIFKGRGASIAGSVSGQLVDNTAYNLFADKVLPKPVITDKNNLATKVVKN